MHSLRPWESTAPCAALLTATKLALTQTRGIFVFTARPIISASVARFVSVISYASPRRCHMIGTPGIPLTQGANSVRLAVFWWRRGWWKNSPFHAILVGALRPNCRPIKDAFVPISAAFPLTLEGSPLRVTLSKLVLVTTK